MSRYYILDVVPVNIKGLDHLVPWSMPEKILVTGGAGFIGSWTVELLVREGYRVVVLDNFSTGSLGNLARVLDRIKVVKGDIRNHVLLDEIIKRYEIDSIIHLAALVSVEEATRNPGEAVRINVNGTHNVLETARKHDLERIVYASSAAVYGDPKYLPIDEDHPLNPKNIYGATKLGGEALVNAYHDNYGLSTISLRYFNVYGPRMRSGPYAGVIMSFIQRILQGKPPVIYGDGHQTRDFIYVEDVAAANLLALRSKTTGSYNVGTGREVSIRELLRIICEEIGRDIKPAYAEPRPGDIRRSVASINRSATDLGFKPRTSLRQGLKNTISYLIKNPPFS